MGWGNSDAANAARQEAFQRQQGINLGMSRINQAFSGFDDNFYNNRVKQYMAYAMPQLAGQYRGTRDRMQYNLANRGLFGGGSMQRQGNALSSEYATQAQGVAQQGQAQAQQLRKDVEGQRSNTVSQLIASADPSAAYQSALGTAATYSAPSTFQPLGPMFQNFSNAYLMNQLSNNTNPASLFYMPRWNMSAPGASVSYGR